MREPLKLMGIFAHPDDETLGVGGTYARYAAEGVETYLVCATLGERGWTGAPEDDPGLEAMAAVRRVELDDAARALGIREVSLLGYIDGDLDQADPVQAAARIAGHIRRVRPQVVMTFPLDGAYGHPDHIAISQFTSAAIVMAADPSAPSLDNLPPHRVSKLYYMLVDQAMADDYLSIVGDIAMDIDGVTRRIVVWPDWSVTTRVDAGDYWREVTQAVSCHRSQLPEMESILMQSEAVQRRLWGNQPFARVFSLVNGGRALETDLFEGLREESRQPARTTQGE